MSEQHTPTEATIMASYWLEGTHLIEACLEKAAAAKPEDAPFPLVGDDAKAWHAAQADAYRHALEMMGVPEVYRAAITKAESLPKVQP